MGEWVSKDQATAHYIEQRMRIFQRVPDMGFAEALFMDVAPLLDNEGYPLAAKAIKDAYDLAYRR